MQLPPDLRAGLGEVLGTVPPERLRATAAELSRRYRAPAPSQRGPLLRSQEDVLSYVAVRLPATYAAVALALQQTRAALPDWEPTSQLDAGAGPGTAGWAAAVTWSGIEHMTFVEREAEMVRVGRRLASHAAATALAGAQWLQEDLGRLTALPRQDLVTAAYVLGELDQASQDRLVGELWQATEGVLVLVEPGTPAGFSRILQARDRLLEAGAHMVAPCPHAHACPVVGKDWCHFAQRVERTSLHRRTKGAELGHEDEKLSFAAVCRYEARPAPARVIRHPQTRPGHIRLELCTPQGLLSEVVARSDAERYRSARRLRWGDALPWSPSPSL